jgi:hypothetical protein
VLPVIVCKRTQPAQFGFSEVLYLGYVVHWLSILCFSLLLRNISVPEVQKNKPNIYFLTSSSSYFGYVK